MLNQPCLVDLIRKLGNDNLESAVLALYNFRLCTDGDFALTGCVSGTDSASAHNDSACREVGTGNALHKLGNLCVGIVNKHTDCVNCFAEVVRRNVRSHTNGNTA